MDRDANDYRPSDGEPVGWPLTRCLGAMAMEKTEKTRTHFAFRIDAWTADGENIVEHIAGIEESGAAPLIDLVFLIVVVEIAH